MKPKGHARNRLHALVRFLLACGIMSLAVLPAAYAQFTTHSLQGLLRDSNGGPLPDGTYTFEVRYMSCSEGTLLWSETHEVMMTGNGVFNLHLGSETPIDPSMFFEDVGLSLTIDGEHVVSSMLCAIDNVPAATIATVALGLGPNVLKAGDGTTIEQQDDGSVMISTTGTFSGGWDGISLIGEGTQENPLRVADGGITEEKLADGSITGLKFADGAIVGGENVLISRLNDGSMEVAVPAATLLLPAFTVDISDELKGDGTPENPLGLADGGVTSEKLADGSVSGPKIAGGAIVGGENILVSRQNDGSVRIDGTSEGFTMVHIEAFGLTGNGTPENPLGLANGGVTSAKLADESVTSAKLADESVTSAKLAEGSVTASKLDDRVIKAGDGIQVTRTNTGSFEIAIKRGAAFRVNQSLDAENLPLLPGIVASPEPTAVYNGNVVLDARGEAVVVLPESFAALSDEVRYQLTCIGGFAPVYVAEEITANRFSIAGGVPGMKVSWQVTGVR